MIPTNACSCDVCKDQCKRPCWGTPSDTVALLDAGYAKRLMLDYWVGDGRNGDDIRLISPALTGYEGRSAPFCPKGVCVFQRADGLCELHDLGLKPQEGCEAHHSSESEDGYKLHQRVAKLWDNDEGDKVVAQWRQLVRKDSDDG